MPPPAVDLGLAPFRLPLFDRWVLASSIAHRLRPAAEALGGFATAEVRVVVGAHPARRPAAAVVLGEPPAAPVVATPPLLVVELAPVCAPEAWLERGVARVWSLGRDAAWVHGPDRPAQRVEAPAVLAMSTASGVALELALPVVHVDAALGPTRPAPTPARPAPTPVRGRERCTGRPVAMG